MNLENPIESLSAALYSACLRDLPAIQYRDRNWEAYKKPGSQPGENKEQYVDKSRRPAPYDCEVSLFPQLWGSTSLGYGGIGGQAMTRAYTIVITCLNTGISAVYFGAAGRLAYIVPWKNEVFRADIKRQALPSCKEAVGRYGLEVADAAR